MSYPDNSYIIAKDLSFVGVLHDVKKSQKALQPVFEAFTNAIEAIKIKEKSDGEFTGAIEIKIFATETTDQNTEFTNLSITDNGVGFNHSEFDRFNTYKLTTKGYKNLGSGRIQYVQYFDNTIIKSHYKDDGKYFEREFVVSKKKEFLDKNAIVLHRYCKATDLTSTGTTISFNTLLENSNIYHNLNDVGLKEALISRYVHYFCYNRGKLPKIELKFYVQSVLKSETTLNDSEIPVVDKTEHFDLSYSRVATDGKSIVKSEKVQDFTIDAFKVRETILKSNNLNLVSKGEVIEESNVSLESLGEHDRVKGYKYLFLVSSEYIDDRDTNLRGVLNIPDRDSFSKNMSLFSSEEILLEDIQEGVNSKINSMYPEIEEVKKQHDEGLEKLKEMFLIDDETAESITISINDSESKILEKFYEAQAKKTAAIDTEIKTRIDRLEHLDTTSDDYSEKLEKEISELVKVIPQQNKIALTQYIARRKLVLELFDKILDKKLLVQSDNNRNKDEKLLHNLIFQQTTTSSENSDLWLINEDFIYFDGTSEQLLKDIKINDQFLFREVLTTEEEEFRISLNENRFAKRPDILLFPDEGKCIIIEFKNPDVNVSEHLLQINNYATLIRNYSKPEFQFHTFYGYLIGEKISSNDVRAYDADFKESYHFDYLFRASKTIAGMFGNSDANLYTEVIKYSTLLKRASRRNEIFIKKLISSKI